MEVFEDHFWRKGGDLGVTCPGCLMVKRKKEASNRN